MFAGSIMNNTYPNKNIYLGGGGGKIVGGVTICFVTIAVGVCHGVIMLGIIFSERLRLFR